MTGNRLLVLSVATALGFAAPVIAQSVESGVTAWQAGDYEAAIRAWRPLADRGDVDAQFNLGHAYRLGRGVPRNMTLAEQWYERAARAGHVEAQAMYGLILFQNGRRQEAMPFVQRAAERGDARAQYVYGTALFNGDVVARDWPRAYAFMTRAAAQGLPYAQSQLTEMNNLIPAEERRRGTELAAALAGQATPEPSTRIASAAPDPLPPSPRVAATGVPPSSAAPAATGTPRPAAPPPAATARPAAPAPAPAATAAAPAAGGRWRVQLGAFSTDANARRAWSAVAARMPSLQPYYVRAGNLVRLQAGPLSNRAAAERTCAALSGQPCFPVAP